MAQLNGFHPGLRKAIIETVGSIAGQCDGMRCDMAMLLMTPIFERTWGHRGGPRPENEYWPEVIQGVRKRYPDVLFIAEAYWDKEWELQQQGFDYCYDKRLYDRLEHDPAEQVRLHLCADLAYQEKLVRFIENHDEPRAAATFSFEKERAAAITASTLQGARLFHEGQFEGRRVRLPVFLRRRPEEVPDKSLQEFYKSLLQALRSKDLREGEWTLCERTGWADNDSYLNVVAWCWQQGADRHLIVVNLSGVRSQTMVRLPWGDLAGRPWRLTDPLQKTVYDERATNCRHRAFMRTWSLGLSRPSLRAQLSEPDPDDWLSERDLNGTRMDRMAFTHRYCGGIRHHLCCCSGFDFDVQARELQRYESNHGRHDGHVSNRVGVLRVFDQFDAGSDMECDRGGDQFPHGGRVFYFVRKEKMGRPEARSHG